MLEFLTVIGVVVLFVVGMLVTTVWLTLRRLRRSRTIAVARDLVGDGVLLLGAFRPRPTGNRAAAVQALGIARAHRLLRQRVTEAQLARAYLGDVPAVLPRLEAEGRRIQMGLGRLVGSPADGAALRARADRHLATLADLTGSVDAATCLPTTDENLVREAEDAALGLRLHTAAYAELMTSGTVTTGARGSLGSLADAS